MRREVLIGTAWSVFSMVMAALMFILPGEETIPYHLIWASFALLYGLFRWPRRASRLAFVAIVVVTAVPLIEHATSRVIGWEECSEIVLMAFIVGLAVWHVDRHRAASDRVATLIAADRERVRKQELATRSGSHEVLTRLTIARGFTELIRDESGDEQIQSDAETVLSELTKASGLASELLTLVRYDSPGALHEVDVDAMLRQIINRWTTTAPRDWRVHSAAGTFWLDPERVEAALDALIENAVKFTDEDAVIELGAEREARGLLLSVRDAGSGIPESDLRRIFEVFETGSTAGERAGSGLGLAIVVAAAKARGGSVEVESQLHGGSTFRIRLPGDASRATAGASASTPPGGVAVKVAVEPSGETPQEWPAIEVGKQGWSRQRGRSASTAGRRSDI